MDVCMRLPEVAAVAMQGLQEAVKECQHQFQHHRWNCSSLGTRSKNPYTSSIFQKGFRETAFAYAISSAGVVISVARACSQGGIINCGCDNCKYKIKESKKDKVVYKPGCSDNLRFAIRFAKKFLDSRENAEDIHSEINLHNNNVGRMAVAENMQIKCKCHGISGACNLKTCWRKVPNLRIVGEALKKKFQGAVLVDQSNLANKNVKITKPNQKKKKQRNKLKQWTPHKQKHKRGLRRELLFYEKSPNFCERDQSLDVLGTIGRTCNRTLPDQIQGSCSSMCCGRGYNLIKQRVTQKQCRFIWCCNVVCQHYTVETWISTCK